MQEKQAIITLNYGYETNAWYKYMREVFIPSIQQYAKRINVDFILMNNNNEKYYKTWNQLQFMDYLDYYDRVMYIDGDCYIPINFRINFFNKINFENIGIYKNTNPLVSQCNLIFVVVILSYINRQFFTPPPVNVQNYKYQRNSDFICFMGKLLKNSCYYGEECYLNECINRYKLKEKIQYLTMLKVKPTFVLYLNDNTLNKLSNNIYHIQLQTQISKYNISNLITPCKKNKQ